MINWKPITEIPIEHWEHNYAISPHYFVKCLGNDPINHCPIYGWTNYSFATNTWMDCWHNTAGSGSYKVIAWTDEEL